MRKLGAGGWLRYCVPAAHGGMHAALDVRSLALIRETLARHSGLADFAFAMQGLGTGGLQALADVGWRAGGDIRAWRLVTLQYLRR